MCEPDTAGTHLLEWPMLCESNKHTCSEDGLAESRMFLADSKGMSSYEQLMAKGQGLSIFPWEESRALLVSENLLFSGPQFLILVPSRFERRGWGRRYRDGPVSSVCYESIRT